MGSSRRTAPGACTETSQNQAGGMRRRGDVLERAILDATLVQLGAAGWKGLTIEGVAARAQTGKAAVYRRWASKAALVEDALRAGVPPLETQPDRGSLRADLTEFCRALRDRMYSSGGQALRAVLDECDREQAEQFHEVVMGQIIEPGKELIAELLRRGVERGDVRPEVNGDLVLDVLPAMMMYRHKTTGRDLSDEDMDEMVDQVMVPLLHTR
ncbi:TetR/AcrR family transcriptional regulator [Streptomyces synnematoformans]